MGAEILLYGYGLVCLSMLCFNLFYAASLRAGSRRMARRVSDVDRLVAAQLRRIQEGKKVEKRHLSRMDRKLSRVRGLLAFDRYLDRVSAAEPVFQQYLFQMQPVFLYLATVYLRRESTQAAYYCHFLARHQLQRHLPISQIQQVIAAYMERDDLYCRVNALKALCAFGSAEVIVQALGMLRSGQAVPLHHKVIVETLLSFTGCGEDLIQKLWESFRRFPPQVQRAILDYIRFQSGDHRAAMLEILQDSSQDKELHFAAIRYFERYPHPPALPILLRFVRDPDPLRWEYAAISASALARYSGGEVVEALLQAMRSPNWYVRCNASESLEAHQLSDTDLLEVTAGSDRYAREMLLYRLEARTLAECPAEPAADSSEEAVL